LSFHVISNICFRNFSSRATPGTPAGIDINSGRMKFCLGARAQIGPRPPHFEFRYHTQLDIHKHTLVTETSTYNTQQTQETNIHALSGIRIRNPSNRAASDQCVRPYGHRDWRKLVLVIEN